ncbi:hypothetical protein J7M02_06195 [Candidatus Aerophobetes bacterium]|nr:hypothetical protein [Candidatus Aerophobetes bacterium]
MNDNINSSTFVFVGVRQQLAKYRAYDLAYGGRILGLGTNDVQEMAADDKYLYILSSDVIQRRQFRDLSLVDTIESEANFDFVDMAIDDSCIYTVEYSSGTLRLKKREKQNFSLLNTRDFGDIPKAIAVDDTSVYITYTLTWAPSSWIRKLDKETLEDQCSGGGSGWPYYPRLLTVDESYVYTSTYYVPGGSYIRVFNKSNLSEAFSKRFSAYTYAISYDADYFYIGGTSDLGGIRKYRKSDFSCVATGPGGEASCIVVTDDYLYVAYIDNRMHIVVIKKHNKEDLTIEQSSELPCFPVGLAKIALGECPVLRAYIINTP